MVDTYKPYTRHADLIRAALTGSRIQVRARSGEWTSYNSVADAISDMVNIPERQFRVEPITKEAALAALNKMECTYESDKVRRDVVRLFINQQGD